MMKTFPRACVYASSDNRTSDNFSFNFLIKIDEKVVNIKYIDYKIENWLKSCKIKVYEINKVKKRIEKDDKKKQ